MKTGTEGPNGPVKRGDNYRIRHKELYQRVESITRAPSQRLTSEIFNTTSGAKATKAKCTILVRRDLQELDIQQNIKYIILYKIIYKIQNIKYCQLKHYVSKHKKGRHA